MIENQIVYIKNQAICDSLMQHPVMAGAANLTPEDDFKVISFTGGLTIPVATRHLHIRIKHVNPELQPLDANGNSLLLNIPNWAYAVRTAALKKKRSKKKKNKQIRNKKRTAMKTKNKIYRISVSRKDFSDELYKYFKKIKINPKHNFINFTSEQKGHKINFIFTSSLNHKYNSNPKWSDIHCKEYKLNDKIIIKTDCDRMEDGKPVKDKSYPGFFKVFVKGYKNLYDYIKAIQKNKLDKKDHKLIFDILIKTTTFNDRSLINHNLDVKTLHFKFI